jgi:hypothetical protein
MCSCDSGYEGVDCSVVLQDPPTVLGVLGGALCDVVDMSCTDVMVLNNQLLKIHKLLSQDRMLLFKRSQIVIYLV